MNGLESLGEFGLIDHFTRGLVRAEGDVLGLGDDCAVLRVGGRTLLVTSDASVEGVHFDLRWCSHEDAGWRAMAGAISDIAAMGGTPLYATVSLALPGEIGITAAESLYAGLRGAAAAADLAIVGGDTTRSRGGIFVDVTVIGEATEARYLPRSGARPGDVLAVTGWPGRSAAALGVYVKAGGTAALPEAIAAAHLCPVPRIAQGQWLARCNDVHAMIDVSDGILQDARHLMSRSGVGLTIEARIRLDDAVLGETCAAHSLDARACYWSGGEDYELLVAIDAGAFSNVVGAFEAAFALPLRRVGVFGEAGGGFAVSGKDWESEGFDHFQGKASSQNA